LENKPDNVIVYAQGPDPGVDIMIAGELSMPVHEYYLKFDM
jgi:hypothetical protein